MDSKNKIGTTRPETSSTGFQILSTKDFPQRSLWKLSVYTDEEGVLAGEVEK